MQILLSHITLTYFSLYHVVPVLPHFTGQTKYVDKVMLFNVLQ